MKYRNLGLSFAILFLLTTCLKEEPISENCTDEMLEHFRSIAQEWGPDQCGFIVTVYLYEGKQYFLQGFRHCLVQRNFYPIDCDGNSPCGRGVGIDCSEFYEKAVEVGTIDIE